MEQEKRNKQVEAAEESERAWIKQQHDDANWMTTEERAKAKRIKLYYTLKERNALSVYYDLYPDERPKTGEFAIERARDTDGRER